MNWTRRSPKSHPLFYVLHLTHYRHNLELSRKKPEEQGISPSWGGEKSWELRPDLKWKADAETEPVEKNDGNILMFCPSTVNVKYFLPFLQRFSYLSPLFTSWFLTSHLDNPISYHKTKKKVNLLTFF